MTCKEFLHFVDAAPLRRRHDRDLLAAREHAEACPGCAVRLAAAESLEQALGSLPTITPPDGLVDDIMGRVRLEVAERPAARQPAPETRLVGPTNREKLGWAAALGGNLALFGVYLYRLDTWAWLNGILSPALGFRAGGISWMVNSGSGLLVAVAGALLLAIGVLSLPGGPVSKRVT